MNWFRTGLVARGLDLWRGQFGSQRFPDRVYVCQRKAPPIGAFDTGGNYLNS